MRRKIAVTVPEHLMKVVDKEIAEGRAPSVSAYVSEAIAEFTEGDTLDALLDEMDEEFGPPSKEAHEWARTVLGL